MIGFLSLFAIAVIVDKWLRTRRHPALLAGVAALLLLLGLWDQTTPGFAADYAALKADYRSDADFIGRIESTLPREAMVFQLPYITYPEYGYRLGMADYDEFRGYLHSRHLRWSYGAIRGRETDAWLTSVSSLPPGELLDPLIFAGFGGIYVDRLGYSDHAAQLETDLAERTGTPPLVSANGRLSFFDLTRATAELRAKYTPDEWQRKRETGWHPVVVQWKRGCFAQEASADRTWRWCGSLAYGYVTNLSSSPVKVDVEIAGTTGYPQPANLSIESPWFSKTVQVSSGGGTFSAKATIPPGRHLLRLICDAPRVSAPADPRTLILRLDKFRISEEAAPPASLAFQAGRFRQDLGNAQKRDALLAGQGAN